eukprot:758761-Pelagomonas_calceolata.AAC.1
MQGTSAETLEQVKILGMGLWRGHNLRKRKTLSTNHYSYILLPITGSNGQGGLPSLRLLCWLCCKCLTVTGCDNGSCWARGGGGAGDRCYDYNVHQN